MWSKIRRGIRRNVEGQGLVELALALPVLLITFLGMVELAFLLRTYLVVVNVNREAARFASRGGAFTDEQVVNWAQNSFSGQLPYQFEGAEANTKIVITRCRVYPNYPTGDRKETECPSKGYGTLGVDSKIDPEAYAAKLEAENDKFNDDLVSSGLDVVRTSQDVVLVEIFYAHQEVLGAPIIDWVFPDEMVVYSRTVMRIGAVSERLY
jgi:Flp pilus assembly protein TadG